MVGALGKVEVVDLRSVWSSESQDFTPWLAEPENIAALADSLGIDLEVVAQEKRVGRFAADILCKDISDDSWVLIENQLERSDHGHLGQLLTYAAGLETATIIWIARSFWDEHRAALQWLNSITDEKFRFFAVQLELWSISGSLPAPRFHVAVAPNDWNRQVKKTTAQVMKAQSEGAARRLQYWQSFLGSLRLENERVRVPAPNTLGNLRFDLKGRDLWITVYSATSLGRVGVFIKGSPEFGKLLLRDRERIEAALGPDVAWEERDPWCIEVALQADASARDDWSRQHRWLASHLTNFLRLFQPYAKAAMPE